MKKMYRWRLPDPRDLQKLNSFLYNLSFLNWFWFLELFTLDKTHSNIMAAASEAEDVDMFWQHFQSSSNCRGAAACCCVQMDKWLTQSQLCNSSVCHNMKEA